MTNKPLIFAVDDELNIRELYTCALQNAGFDIVCFDDGNKLFDALKKDTPELILLDIMLDGADGYEILKSLRADGRTSNIPVIMVSAKGEEISKVKGLNLGADDYIAKPFGVLELIARINANIRKKQCDRQATAFKDIEIDEKAHQIKVCGNIIQPTLKEYELIKLLVGNAPDVVLRDAIFDNIWGDNYGGETRTLDIHIASIRKLLQASSAAIETIRGVGYALK